MRSSALLSFLVFIGFLSSGCYASTCANFSLPNFLDIGKCLKKSGDLCSAKSDGTIEFIEDLVRCFIEGVSNADPQTQLYLIYNYLKYLAARNDFDIVLPAIDQLCKNFNVAVGSLFQLPCSTLTFNKKAVCGKPIFLSFVTNTPFAQCLDVTGLTCDENKPVNEPAVIGFIRVLVCLIVFLSTQSPNSIFQETICFTFGFFLSTFNSAGKLIFTPFVCAYLNAAGFPCPGIKC